MDGEINLILQEDGVLYPIEIKMSATHKAGMAVEKGRSEGEKSGFSKGEKSGIERGAAQEKREIAKNLKSLKLPVEQIRTATGLTLAEIEAL